jgi:calcineurin-like phosphoesterase family protein
LENLILKVINFTKPFYLISDCHFFHTKLFFEFGLRTEFKDTEDVNRTMFENWNNTISDEDYIFFLGDFVCGTNEHGLDKYKTAQILYDSLNGKKIFIKGSHDEHMKEYTKIPIQNGPIEILYKGKRILLNHEPIKEFEQHILIHGHVHKSFPYHYKQNCFNISCEVINYIPIHIDKILEDFLTISI